MGARGNYMGGEGITHALVLMTSNSSTSLPQKLHPLLLVVPNAIQTETSQQSLNLSM